MLEQLLESYQDSVSESNWEIFRAGYSACFADIFRDSKKVYMSVHGVAWIEDEDFLSMLPPAKEAYLVRQKELSECKMANSK